MKNLLVLTFDNSISTEVFESVQSNLCDFRIANLNTVSAYCSTDYSHLEIIFVCKNKIGSEDLVSYLKENSFNRNTIVVDLVSVNNDTMYYINSSSGETKGNLISKRDVFEFTNLLAGLIARKSKVGLTITKSAGLETIHYEDEYFVIHCIKTDVKLCSILLPKSIAVRYNINNMNSDKFEIVLDLYNNAYACSNTLGALVYQTILSALNVSWEDLCEITGVILGGGPCKEEHLKLSRIENYDNDDFLIDKNISLFDLPVTIRNDRSGMFITFTKDTMYFVKEAVYKFPIGITPEQFNNEIANKYARNLLVLITKYYKTML